MDCSLKIVLVFIFVLSLIFVLTVILGNAYVFLFFTCGQNPQLSQQALSAYSQSVSIEHLFKNKRSEPFAPLCCVMCVILPLIFPHV